MTLKVIQGHIRPSLCQNHSRTFVYGPIFMKICMNANIMKTQFFLMNYLLNVMEMFCDHYFKIFIPKYNLDLRSCGQLLSLFY